MCTIQIKTSVVAKWDILLLTFSNSFAVLFLQLAAAEHWPLTKIEEIKQIHVFNASHEALIIARPQLEKVVM